MPGLGVQRPGPRIRIGGVIIRDHTLVIAFVVLGALAWGIGWMAHGMFDRQTSLPPTVSPERPEGLQTATHRSTASIEESPGATGASTPLPATSTFASTATAQVQTLTVAADDRGVYDVIRRACGLPRDYVLSPSDEITRETWRLNQFAEESPPIEVGQAVQVPIRLCP